MRRIFIAAVMAVAALTGLSLAGPGVVSAGASSHAAAAHIGNLYGKGSAGYTMTGGGWRFRYIETTLTVPAAATRATSAWISLGANRDDLLALGLMAGGGPGSIQYIWTDLGPASLSIAPDAGDQVTLSIYYDRTASIEHVTAVDHTQGTSATWARYNRRVFGSAQMSGGGPTWSLASSDTRLWAFKDTRVTTYNGTHGTIFGPWGTYRVIGTRGGTSTGAVVLWPTYPWNNGHNFSVVWRGAS